MRKPPLHRFTSRLEESRNKLWGCHFRVPRSVAQRLVTNASRRVVCTLNDAAEYQCALIPGGSGSYVITVNKQLQRKLKVGIGSTIHIALRKDDSTYGLPMPEEFEELLAQDKEGNRLFQALTRGRQRTLLYIVGKSRTPEERLRRANIILRHLLANAGTINYRTLSASLKKSNI